jgi:glycosyltransferase involved in cell wall biosynthesis
MAHSLPVVATAVGGVPLLLRDRETARLAEPRSPAALAGAISEVLHDAALRRTIIRNGFALARTKTVEQQSAELISLLSDWVRQRPSFRRQVALPAPALTEAPSARKVGWVQP